MVVESLLNASRCALFSLKPHLPLAQVEATVPGCDEIVFKALGIAWVHTE